MFLHWIEVQVVGVCMTFIMQQWWTWLSNCCDNSVELNRARWRRVAVAMRMSNWRWAPGQVSRKHCGGSRLLQWSPWSRWTSQVLPVSWCCLGWKWRHWKLFEEFRKQDVDLFGGDCKAFSLFKLHPSTGCSVGHLSNTLRKPHRFEATLKFEWNSKEQEQ